MRQPPSRFEGQLPEAQDPVLRKKDYVFSLEAKTVVVTGGGKGIGRGISLAMGRAGARVIITGRDEAALSEVVEELRSRGLQGLAVAADLRDPDGIAQVVSAAEQMSVEIDCWVNNAGGAGVKDASPLLEMTEATWDAVLELNLKSPFLCSQAAARSMQGKGGSIINLSSGSARLPSPLMSHYAAAKAAVENLTVAMAVEWGHLGIRVNAIQPGVIDTHEKRGRRGAGWLSSQAGLTPLGVNGTPDDIAAACVFLASDEAKWVTGSTLVIDGGCRIPLGHKEFMQENPRNSAALGRSI